MLTLRPRRHVQTTRLDPVRYSDGISLGKSPSILDMEKLARGAGFRAILSLNTEGEPYQVLSPNVEATWAHAFCMQHERVSIGVSNIRPDCVSAFLDTLRRIHKPVYVHSLQGRRAATVMTVHLAIEHGLPAEPAAERARSLGIDSKVDEVRRHLCSQLGECNQSG